MVCAPIPASAAVVNRGTEGAPLSEIRPAPKSIYPDQAVITAEPAPSDVDPAYLGPVLLMKSAIVDLEAGLQHCLCGGANSQPARPFGRSSPTPRT
jgi:hypothetical protein